MECCARQNVRATASISAKFLSILQKINLLFSILHINFYKTFTSVCLFYHLFYLNNHFPHFYYYFISNSLSLHSRDSLHSHLKLFSPSQSFADPSTDTHRSTSVDPLSLSLLVCPCVDVFDFVVSVFDFVVDF